MNETIKLRESIRGRTDTFVASDFDTDKAVGILNKMYIAGELEVYGYDKSSHGRPVKRYRIVKLHEFKVRRGPRGVYHKAEAPERPLYAQLWSLVYPDLFMAPDFSGYRQSVRRFIGA